MANEKIVKPIKAQPEPVEVPSVEKKEEPIIEEAPKEDAKEPTKLEINDGQKWEWNFGPNETEHPLWNLVGETLGLSRTEMMGYRDRITRIGKEIIEMEDVGEDRQRIVDKINELMNKLPFSGQPVINLWRYLITRNTTKGGEEK